MNKGIRISIIIPYFKNEFTIERALNSVENQTFKEFEVILVNDGSPDRTEELVNKWIDRNSNILIKHLKQENSGPSKARNLGIRNAEGEYIALLDADDSWFETKLEKQMNVLTKNKDIWILGSDHCILTEGRVISKGDETGSVREITFGQRLIKNYFITPTVIIKGEIFKNEKLGFNENQKYAEDTLLYLQIMRRHKAAKINEPLTKIYKPEISREGLSANIVKTEKYELLNYIRLYRENETVEKNKINFGKLCFFLSFSIIKFIRRVLIMMCR